jgi:hypothetical protein
MTFLGFCSSPSYHVEQLAALLTLFRTVSSGIKLNLSNKYNTQMEAVSIIATIMMAICTIIANG